MNVASIQILIADTKRSVDEYEELTGLEATALRTWLSELEHRLAAARSLEARRRQDETIAEMAKISHKLTGGM